MPSNFSKLTLALTVASSLVLGACSKQTAEDHLIAADQFIAANNNAAAVLELKSAIQLSPNSAEARFKLGELYIQQGNYDGAEKELNRASELGYDAAQIMPLLSQAYKQTGAVNALADIDYADDAIPASESARMGYYKLTALMELEKLIEAEDLIVELEALDTSSVYRGLASSYTAIIEEDYERALEQTKALRKQAPLNADVLRQLSKLHLYLQQRDEAAEVMTELSGILPNDIEIQFTFAALLIDLAKFEQAEPVVDKLLALNPENGILNQYKGVILAGKEEYQLALKHLDKAILDGGDNSVVRLLAGYSAYRVQRHTEVIKHLSLIADELPGNHPALRILADSQLVLGQNLAASQTLMTLEDNTDEDAALFSRAGFQLLQQGNIEAAKTVVTQGSKVEGTTEDLMRMGILQLSMNDVEGFIKLEEAVEQAPESAMTQRTLATAYLLSGQLDKASALATSWKAQQPSNYQPFLLAGEVALRQQQADAAAQEFNQALALAPDLPETKLAIASLAIAEGDMASATEQVRVILDAHPDHGASLLNYYALLRQTGDTQDALARATKALDNSDDNRQLRLVTAQLFFQDSKYPEVLSVLEPVKYLTNTPALFWQLKGQALIRTNAVRDASKHYQAWIAQAPYNKDAVLGSLLTLDIERKFDEALNLARSYGQKRSDAQIDLLRAYFHSMLGQQQDSGAILDQLPNSAQQLPFVRSIYARNAILDKRFNDALPDAKVAYEQQQNIRNLLLYVAALDGTNNRDESLNVIAGYVAANPSDTRGQMLHAERLISRDKAAAMAIYANAVEAAPENFLALNNLAYLYLEDGRLDDALPLATKAVELRPTSPEANDTLAQVYVAQGEVGQARALYEKVVVRPVANDDVMANFIALLMQMGDVELAKRRMEERDWRSPVAQKKAQDAIAGS